MGLIYTPHDRPGRTVFNGGMRMRIKDCEACQAFGMFAVGVIGILVVFGVVEIANRIADYFAG